MVHGCRAAQNHGTGDSVAGLCLPQAGKPEKWGSFVKADVSLWPPCPALGPSFLTAYNMCLFFFYFIAGMSISDAFHHEDRQMFNIHLEYLEELGKLKNFNLPILTRQGQHSQEQQGCGKFLLLVGFSGCLNKGTCMSKADEPALEPKESYLKPAAYLGHVVSPLCHTGSSPNHQCKSVHIHYRNGATLGCHFLHQLTKKICNYTGSITTTKKISFYSDTLNKVHESFPLFIGLGLSI